MFGDLEFQKAIRLEHPSTIPVCCGVLPAMWIHHGKETQPQR